MRVLVVQETFPWPAGTGYLMRLVNTVRALARLGDVELFVLVPRGRTEPCVIPPDEPVARFGSAPKPAPANDWRHRLTWLMTPGSLPLELAGRDYRPARAAFDAWAKPTYDLVWFSRPAAWLALGTQRRGPTVVDLDDLEDEKIHARLALGHRSSGDGTPKRQPAVGSAARAQARLNARRWRRLQLSIADTVDAVTLCSEMDVARLDVPNAHVVPNGYDPPLVPAGRPTVGDPPTLMFPGALMYPPNVDAARHLVRDVLPLLRARVPNAQLRLVGSANEQAQELHDPPRVVVTGFVDDIIDELARADIVTVPIRYGSGTRIKILEAFAHQIPVVSTTVGAEGLGVDGRHVALADGAPAFAGACEELLMNVERRTRMTEEAHVLFLERHQWAVAHDATAALGRVVAAKAASGDGVRGR